MKSKRNNFDFRMYPFSSCSLMNFLSASSSSLVVGMILQLIASGAPSFSSMAWSHGLDGGKQCDSSSLNTFEWRWYSSGIFTSCWYWWASCASLVEIVKHSSSSSVTIGLHYFADTLDCLLFPFSSLPSSKPDTIQSCNLVRYDSILCR